MGLATGSPIAAILGTMAQNNLVHTVCQARPCHLYMGASKVVVIGRTRTPLSLWNFLGELFPVKLLAFV